MKSLEHCRTHRIATTGTALFLSGIALTGCAATDSGVMPSVSPSAESNGDENDFRVERKFLQVGK